jgi:CRP-like cAMP-binding protein
MFFVFAGLLDVFLPSDVAAKNAFKAIAGKRSGDSVVLNAVAGPSNNDIDGSARQASAKRELKKVNEISAGSYFGENGLFTNGKRDAYVKAQTSCILYRLSRESLELVFDRYPLWRQKVLTIANIHREQARLVQLSREEQRRGMTTSTGLVLSRSDIMNERAEGLKEMRYHTRVQRTSSAQSDYIGQVLVDRLGLKRVSQLLNGLVHGAAVQSSFYLCWLRLMVACTAYVTIMIPYELTMESMDRTTVVVVLAKVLELLCEVAFVVDVWFWWHVHECPASMELYDQNLQLQSVVQVSSLHQDLQHRGLLGRAQPPQCRQPSHSVLARVDAVPAHDLLDRVRVSGRS